MIKINDNLITKAEHVENELDNSKLKYNATLIDKGIDTIDKLLSKYSLDIFDVIGDDVNYITDYDNAVDTTQDIVQSDINNAPAVNDLAFLYNHDFLDYVFINGYARVEIVSNSDVSSELDDIIDYIKDNQLNIK